MKFRVYNKNGRVQITKECTGGQERMMFSDLKDGEVAEIETEVTQCSKSARKRIDSQPSAVE